MMDITDDALRFVAQIAGRFRVVGVATDLRDTGRLAFTVNGNFNAAIDVTKVACGLMPGTVDHRGILGRQRDRWSKNE